MRDTEDNIDHHWPELTERTGGEEVGDGFAEIICELNVVSPVWRSRRKEGRVTKDSPARTNGTDDSIKAREENHICRLDCDITSAG